MKLKNGIEVDVKGQIHIENNPFFITKLATPIYKNDTLVSYVLYSAFDFDIPGVEFLERVDNESLNDQ